MKLLPPLLTFATIVAMTSPVIANGGLSVNGNGVRVTMTTQHGGTSATTSAVSDWVVKSNVNQVVLQWKTTPFVHVEHDGIKSDAMIAVRVTDQLGRLQASPRQSSDRTNVASGDEEAAVMVGIRGNGKLNIQLHVGIDDQHAVAGKHCANVTLTLTSH